METVLHPQASETDEAMRALRATVDLAPVGIAQFEGTGRFLLANQRLCSIFGYSREELMARTFQQITFPDDLEGCLQVTADLAAGKVPRYRHAKRFVRPDGSIVWVCVTVGAVRDASDAVSFFVGMAEDVTDEHASEERRRAAEARLEAALAASSTGTFRWDIVNDQLWWDPNLYRLMGLEAREGFLTAEASMANVHPEDLEKLAAAVQRAATDGGSFRQEFRIVRPDGEVRCLHCLGNTLADGDGRPTHMTGAVTDVTDAWRDRQESDAARAAAERASRMREDMVAVVAHDLRNPLQSIGMGAGLLLQAEASAEQHALVANMIARTVRSMQRLLNDLLDVSRMDAGTFVVAPTTFEPAAFLAEACELFQARAAERGLALSCDCAPGIPAIRGDRDRLLQVMSNLVGNALKFSCPPGEIRLTVEPVPGAVRIAVQDCGPGIAPEHMSRLFDRFWQHDPHRSGGAGLGLAIAKGIVEAHGGRIGARSAASGATFDFTIPA